MNTSGADQFGVGNRIASVESTPPTPAHGTAWASTPGAPSPPNGAPGGPFSLVGDNTNRRVGTAIVRYTALRPLDFPSGRN